jgi:hypothetical protein
MVCFGLGLNVVLRVLKFGSQFRFLFLLIAALTFPSCSMRDSSTQRFSTKKAVGAFCPMQTPEEWQQFLTGAVDSENWVKTCEDDTCDAKFYSVVKENIQDVFDRCSDFIKRNPKIGQCTDNFRRFTVAWLQQHSSDSYGFTVDNHTYLTAQDSPDKPVGMMNPPEEIIAALPDRARVEQAARKSGLKYLTHDSALGGSRTFVLISDPAGRFDQWMLLNLQGGDSAVKDGTPLSIVTVQKKTKAGQQLSKVRIHFRDYTLVHKSKNNYRLTLNEDNNGKCYACHSGGMRQLIARRTPILESRPSLGEAGYDPSPKVKDPPEFAFERLMEFNRKLRSYGAPDWEGMVHVADHGPALGEAQGCMDCHNGKTRGVLTVTTSHAQLAQKLLYELSMPSDTHLPRMLERREMQNPKLSKDEEKSLVKAFDVHEDLLANFESSRLPMLKKWLLQRSCL